MHILCLVFVWYLLVRAHAHAHPPLNPTDKSPGTKLSDTTRSPDPTLLLSWSIHQTAFPISKTPLYNGCMVFVWYLRSYPPPCFRVYIKLPAIQRTPLPLLFHISQTISEAFPFLSSICHRLLKLHFQQYWSFLCTIIPRVHIVKLLERAGPIARFWSGSEFAIFCPPSSQQPENLIAFLFWEEIAI